MKKQNRVKRSHYFWAIVRIVIGLIFLWAFFDKLIGLGFTTCLGETGSIDILCESAWINGGSPTYGFLNFATKGPFMEFYSGFASSLWVEWVFMLSLLFIGLTLTLGFLVRIGAITGALWMILMYTAVLPPEHHPFLDDHIVYFIVLLGIAFVHTCKHLGLGKWWTSLSIVKNNKILE